MKQLKREYLPLYAIYDRTGIAAHLERMAAKGWLLEKLGDGCWTYRRIEPQTMRFSVVYLPRITPFTPAPSEDQETFLALCADAGWTLAASSAQMQILRSQRPDPLPLETDPETEFKSIHAAMRSGFLRAYWMLLLLSLAELCYSGWQLLRDPIAQLSDPLSLNAALGFLPLALLTGVELLHYYRWRRRSRAALETAAPLPELHSLRAVNAAVILFSAMQLFTAFAFAGTSSPEAAIFMAAFLLCLVLMVILANGIRKSLQKLRFRAPVNRAVTYSLILVLTLAMMGGLLALILSGAQRGIF